MNTLSLRQNTSWKGSSMEKQLETLKEKCSLVYSKRKSVLDAVFELNEMSPPDEFDYDKAIASIDSFFNDIDSYYELAKEYSEPNFFEIAGITRMETKHSRTIAYFLDANKNHGLGDMFVKKLLHNVISANKHINMSIEDLDVLDFSSFVIFLESVHNIDILMLSQKEKLAIIIENKVYATERIKGNDDGQLNKYRTLINHDYQDYKQLCIFLSPDGKAASDLDNWHIANYSMIVEAIEEILNDQNNNNLISYDIRLILRHYENMICRHLIPSKRIIKYSNKLIKKYPLALNLIYKFGPDMVSKATEYIKSFLSENAEILEIRIIEKNQHGFIYFRDRKSVV